MRKSMPLCEWPAADRRSWKQVTTNGDLFDGKGPAAHWATSYQASVVFSYGRWLGHLHRHDRPALPLAPAERVTTQRVREYVDALETEITASSIHIYVSRLYEFIRVITPNYDWSWLRGILRSLTENVTSPNKRPRLVDADRLLALGIRMMETTDLDGTDHLGGIIQYRDGLIIALLAARPLRLRNLASITIGRQLLRTGDRYDLVFTAEETKNRQPLDFHLPEALTPYLNRYLAKVRPLFPGALHHEGLWASAKGGPMVRKALYDRVCLRTKEAFGRAVNPHLFRDCVATTIAIKDPVHVEIARDILGHSRLETTESYYNQARTLEASRQYHEVILAAREQLAPGYPGAMRKGG